MNRTATLLHLAFRIFSFGRKGEKLSRPLLGSILGIALSLIPLVVVIHISDGMIRGITERTLETGSYHLQTYPYSAYTIGEMLQIARQLDGADAVRHTTVERQGYGLIYSPEGRGGATIRAVESDFYSGDEGVREYLDIDEGVFDLRSEDSAVIGKDMARKLRLGPGDEVKILTGKFFSNGRFLPKVSAFRISGVFSTGFDELDRMWIFIPLEAGEKILAENSSQTIIGIKTLHPYDDLKGDMLAVRDILPKRWGIFTWENLNRAQQENYKTTRMLLIFIMALIVIVAIINISSSLVMLVLEKQEEVAVLKCLGAAPEDITLAYIFTGLFTGITGTAAGIAAGLAVSLNINGLIRGADSALSAVFTFFRIILSPLTGQSGEIHVELMNSAYYLQNIPVKIEPFQILLIATGTIVLSVLSSALPARRAGKIKPLDVMRKK